MHVLQLAAANGDGAGTFLLAQPFEREGSACMNDSSQIVHLFHELRLPLYRYLISIGVRSYIADEIAQESFLRLYEELDSGVKVSNPRSWVFTVAHNMAVSIDRKDRRLVFGGPAAGDAGQQDEAGTEQTAAWADPRPNPEEEYLETEQLQRFNQSLLRLTNLQRQALSLRTEGLRYREIADVLGISVSSVAEAIQRALARLAGEINE